MTTAATIPHVLGEATLDELEQGLRGQLVRPGDDGYDEARAIWNGAHDRRPALIVRCDGDRGVQARRRRRLADAQGRPDLRQPARPDA
jgi:hypothetical protein